jgi:hypothetical protein
VVFGKFWSSSFGYSTSQKALHFELFIFLLQNFGYIQLPEKKADHKHPAPKSNPFN